jgi:hypothetical protein
MPPKVKSEFVRYAAFCDLVTLDHYFCAENAGIKRPRAGRQQGARAKSVVEYIAVTETLASTKWKNKLPRGRQQLLIFAQDVLVCARQLGDSTCQLRSPATVRDMISDLSQQAAAPRVFRGQDLKWQSLCSQTLDLTRDAAMTSDGARFLGGKVCSRCCICGCLYHFSARTSCAGRARSMMARLTTVTRGAIPSSRNLKTGVSRVRTSDPAAPCPFWRPPWLAVIRLPLRTTPLPLERGMQHWSFPRALRAHPSAPQAKLHLPWLARTPNR